MYNSTIYINPSTMSFYFAAHYIIQHEQTSSVMFKCYLHVNKL